MIKELMLILNDVHLRHDNIDTVTDIMVQAAEKALSFNLTEVYCAGDFFDTRASQKLAVLRAFHDILEVYKELGIKLVMIHGNHDLSSYSESYSWLSPFQDHECIDLISFPRERVQIGELLVSFLPFQEEEKMVAHLKAMGEADILIGHFELNGSISNGIEAKGRPISASMLKKFGLVLLGHYHDTHYVTKTVMHMPSAYQRNFAEDTTKGFTVVMSDGSVRHEQSIFRPFETVTLNVDEDVTEETKELIKMAKGDINIRVKLEGSQTKLEAFKRDKLKMAGIDVKVNHEKVYAEEKNIEDREIGTIDVEDAFEKFCEKENINKEAGLKYLKVKK